MVAIDDFVEITSANAIRDVAGQCHHMPWIDAVLMEGEAAAHLRGTNAVQREFSQCSTCWLAVL